MRRRGIVLLLAAAVCAAAAEQTQQPAAAPAAAHVSRAEIAGVERTFNNTIQRLSPNSPYDLIGMTRGVYLGGYGAVFTAEVNLITVSPLLNFRPAFTKPEIESMRQRKIERLRLFKQKMQEMLQSAAAAMNTVPPNEQIVLGVTFYYLAFENRQDLPAQVVMQASRQALLDSLAARTAPAIQTAEF